MRDPLKVCGADRGYGRGLCQKWPIKGKKRCRNHGGRSTGPKNKSNLKKNTRAVKGGIYRQYLDDVDKQNYDNAELGNVETELRIAKVRVARVLKAEESEEYPDTDYDTILDRALARVASLEVSQAKLLEGSGDNLPPLIDPDPDL